MNNKYYLEFGKLSIFIGVMKNTHKNDTMIPGLTIRCKSVGDINSTTLHIISMNLVTYRTVLKIATMYNCVDKFEELCSNTVNQ